MRLFILTALFVAAGLALLLTPRPEPTHACSCAPGPGPPPDVVFAGAAVSAQYVPRGLYGGDQVLVQFKVEVVWRGPLHETMFVATGASSSCGMPQLQELLDKPPKEWDSPPTFLIYAYASDLGDGLGTSICAYYGHHFSDFGTGRRPIPGSIAPTPEPWLQRDGYESVFIGTITSVRYLAPSMDRTTSARQQVDFRVLQVFRGPSDETRSVQVRPSGAGCGLAELEGLDDVNLNERPRAGVYLVYTPVPDLGSIYWDPDVCLLTDSVSNIRRNYPSLGLEDGWKPAADQEPTPPKGACNAPAANAPDGTDFASLALLAGIAALAVRPKRPL